MNKKLLIPFALAPLAIAICSTAVIAQSTTPSTSTLTSPLRFEDLDSNKDGNLSQAELTTSGKTTVRLSDADKDKNGSLSRPEYEAAKMDHKAATGNMNSQRSGAMNNSGSAGVQGSEKSNSPAISASSDPKTSMSTSASITKFEDLDSNKDGNLSQNELIVSGKTTVRLSSADKDKNGSVSPAEYDAAAKFIQQGASNMNSQVSGSMNNSGSAGVQGSEKSNSPAITGSSEPKTSMPSSISITRFEDLDSNKDGILNQTELTVTGKTTVRLSEADKDKNGSVSRTEYDAAAKMHQGASNLDSQHIGADSKTSVSVAKFEDLDTNKDGALSPGELTVHGKSTFRLPEADKDKNGSVSRTEFDAAIKLNSQGGNISSQPGNQPADSGSTGYNRSEPKGGNNTGTMGGSSNSYDSSEDN